MRTPKFLVPALLFLVAGAATISAAQAPVPLEDFNVTNGKIEKAAGNRLTVSTKEMRAVLKDRTPQNVTMKFIYLGPTSEVSRLGSGAIRSQFGIKLRELDQCNLVYVMWRFTPDQKIVVSIKRNPGQSTHEQCLDHGYINIKSRVKAPVPLVETGQSHTLNASMNGTNLDVKVDGRTVWHGDLGPEALQLDGPVGLRSDNAHVVFDYYVGR